MQLPAVNDLLGEKYRIEEVLGEGGFGCVYLGVDENSGRAVAIKVLKPTQEGYPIGRSQRFLREMRAIAKLQSPNTLTLYDVGETADGLLFMVTEYIDGQDLSRLLMDRGTLSERETVHIVMQVLLSLEEAHDAGILHRDIKPGNIRLFHYEKDPLRAKLLDFGLAQSLGGDEARLTGTGRVIGTPRYMAPEQLLSQKLTPRSDLYSLALVARECVLGRSAVASGVTRWIRDTDDVSPAFRELVNAMLEHEVDARPSSARAAYEQFRARRHELDLRAQAPPTPTPIVEAPPTAPMPPSVEQAPQGEGVLPTRVFAIAALVILVGLTVWTALRPDADPTPRVAVPTPPTTAVNPLAPPSEEVIDASNPDAQTADQTSPCAARDAPTGNLELLVDTGMLSAPDVVPLYVPKDYRPGERHPLIVGFRDFRSSGKALMQRSRLRRIAQQHGAIIVAPQDRGTMEGVWESAGDIESAIRAVKEVQNQYCVDEQRIFAFGHGMGGRGATRFACDFPGVAALATTSYRPLRSERPCGDVVPRVSFDALRSLRAPAEGGSGCGVPGDQMSLVEYERSLRSQGSCSDAHEAWFEDDHGTCKQWSCETAVVTCQVDGGREFYGTKPRGVLDASCDGEPVKFPYTAQIWRFFAQVAPRPD